MATLFAHLNDPVPPLARYRGDLPPGTDAVLARGLAKEPRDRYARCGEFAAALRDALAERRSPASPRPPGRRTARRWGRRRRRTRQPTRFPRRPGRSAARTGARQARLASRAAATGGGSGRQAAAHQPLRGHRGTGRGRRVLLLLLLHA